MKTHRDVSSREANSQLFTFVYLSRVNIAFENVCVKLHLTWSSKRKERSHWVCGSCDDKCSARRECILQLSRFDQWFTFECFKCFHNYFARNLWHNFWCPQKNLKTFAHAMNLKYFWKILMIFPDTFYNHVVAGHDLWRSPETISPPKKSRIVLFKLFMFWEKNQPCGAQTILLSWIKLSDDEIFCCCIPSIFVRREENKTFLAWKYLFKTIMRA